MMAKMQSFYNENALPEDRIADSDAIKFQSNNISSSI